MLQIFKKDAQNVSKRCSNIAPQSSRCFSYFVQEVNYPAKEPIFTACSTLSGMRSLAPAVAAILSGFIFEVTRA